jgi:hypothetical protein
MSSGKWWNYKASNYLASPNINWLSANKLAVHDFFGPQPVKDADVFMLRHIIHDWSDQRAVSLLQHLRDAAKPTTQLVIIESILPVASEDEDARVKSIPGAHRPHAPAPLLPNYGVSTAGLHYFDITVSCLTT